MLTFSYTSDPEYPHDGLWRHRSVRQLLRLRLRRHELWRRGWELRLSQRLRLRLRWLHGLCTAAARTVLRCRRRSFELVPGGTRVVPVAGK